MSVATEFPPVVYIPEPARSRPERLASVTALHEPSERTAALPVRLTRRGVVVVAVAVAALAAALVCIAWLSAPPSATGRATPRSIPDTITVHTGDSLWTIATRLAPGRDPRGEVADLQRINRLGTAALVPGQVLRTH